MALRFLAAGYSKKKALLIMFLWNLFFAFSGILLSQVSNFQGVVILVIVVLISLFSIKKVSRVAIDG
jgi:ABC-type dipeptide/oligopeptide/nickel transport system permease subunit